MRHPSAVQAAFDCSSSSQDSQLSNALSLSSVRVTSSPLQGAYQSLPEKSFIKYENRGEKRILFINNIEQQQNYLILNSFCNCRQSKFKL